jgi:hypothetical protein
VLINTSNVAVARGAVLPGVRSPWANPFGPGANYVLGQLHVPATGTPSTRIVASRRVPTMAQPAAGMAADLPIDTRKQNVHKTRVNAGGDGASGPHPEREPA